VATVVTLGGFLERGADATQMEVVAVTEWFIVGGGLVAVVVTVGAVVAAFVAAATEIEQEALLDGE
jgi:hypothetical protein